MKKIIRNKILQIEFERKTLNSEISLGFLEVRENKTNDENLRIGYARDIDRIVNSIDFSSLSRKYVTSSNSNYSLLLFSIQASRNCETLSRIFGVNSLLCRAVSYGFFYQFLLVIFTHRTQLMIC